jgi:hypothetical protein
VLDFSGIKKVSKIKTIYPVGDAASVFSREFV